MMMMMMNCTINPPTPCLWQAPVSAQKPQKENQAGHSSRGYCGEGLWFKTLATGQASGRHQRSAAGRASDSKDHPLFLEPSRRRSLERRVQEQSSSGQVAFGLSWLLHVRPPLGFV